MNLKVEFAAHLYHLYLDKDASFTLEYIDIVLAMRLNNTYPWYVPTSRFIFDVDVNKIGWCDIPYFVNKRSEENSHKQLKNEKKISVIERLVLPFPDN